MAILNRIGAVYLLLTAVAVAALLIITPLIHDGSADYPIWEIMNYFMAAGVLAMLVTAFVCKKQQDASGGDGDIKVSLVFCGAIVLTMLFFWGWFWVLNPDSETGEAVTSHVIHFPLVDSLYTVLGIVTARRLWRTAA